MPATVPTESPVRYNTTSFSAVIGRRPGDTRVSGYVFFLFALLAIETDFPRLLGALLTTSIVAAWPLISNYLLPFDPADKQSPFSTIS